jgi:hypothetical protein
MICTVRDADGRFCGCPIFMEVKVKVNQPETKMIMDSRHDPEPYFSKDDGYMEGYDGGLMKATIHIKGTKMIPIKEFNNMYNTFMVEHQILRTSDIYDDILSEVVSATEI